MVNLYKRNGDFLLKAKNLPAWRGLLFSKKLNSGEGVLLDVRKYSSNAALCGITMLFVFQKLDIAWLDKGFRVVDIRKGVKPFTFYVKPRKKACYILESSSLDLKIGDYCRL